MVKKSSIRHPVSLCDTHIHTHLCNHATGEMEEYVLAGIRKGLEKIIFLEHMEEGINHLQGKTWLSEDEFDRYFSEGQRLRSAYKNDIEIGLGVECGYNPDCGETLKKRLAERSWDQVGISCHFLKIEGQAYHLNLLSRKQENIVLARQIGAEKLLDRYFTTLTEAVRCLPGTMLCHLDTALRYLPEVSLTESHYDQIDNLLQVISKRAMAIEINTSGFDIRQEQFPNRRILSLANSCSIPFVLGSDAHKPDDVGRHFDTITSLLPSGLYR